MEEIIKTENIEIECGDEATLVFLTVNEIIDRYKVKESQIDGRAMQHMTGLFTVQLVIPVKKKISRDYINNFFFFNVLGVNENFAKRKLGVNELHQYLLKKRDKCNYAIYLDNVKECYEDDKFENGIVELSISRDEVVTVEFPRVD